MLTVGTDDAGNPVVYTSGDDSGKVFEVTNPFGTQEMADYILTKIRGYQYQPYTADGALLDPAMQLGDAVAVNGVYSGIYNRQTEFGTLMRANISAPVDEEIEHEYVIESSTDRAYQRTVRNLKSRISLNAMEISAKVSKEDGDPESFAWSLQSNGWTLSDNTGAVFKADSTGVKVRGEITAVSGTIGSSSNGFVISASNIHNGMTSFSDNNNGVYIGTDGIALGGGKFKVTSSGALTATSADITGAVTCTSLTVNGQRYTPSQVSGGISGGSRLGSAFSGTGTSGNQLSCGYLRATALRGDTVTAYNALIVGGRQYRATSITVGQSTYTVLATG